MHTSFKKYKESGCGLNVNLMIILHQLRDSYPTRNGCKAESVWLGPIYLCNALEGPCSHKNQFQNSMVCSLDEFQGLSHLMVTTFGHKVSGF